MARCGDGFALGPDLLHAAIGAGEQARAGLDGAPADLATVFVAGSDHAVVEAALLLAAERVGARATLGCSAFGVIGDGQTTEATSSVSVWAASLPGAQVRAFHLEVLRAPESIAVVGMPDQHTDDAVAVLLADPWTFPVDGFVAGSTAALPGLPIVGGMAYSERGAGAVRLLIDGRIVERGAVGMVVGGDVDLRTVVSQGCRPVGPAMTVTAADGNVLLGLAGQPALDKLREVVSTLPAVDQALASRGLQVGIALDGYLDDPGQGDFLVRGVLGVDRERAGLAVGDVLEVGSLVRFQVRDAAAASADLRASAARLRSDPAGDPVAGALLFACNARGSRLFTDADHDVRVVRTELGTTRVGGFLAAGEIGPVGGRNHVHGYSAALMLVGAGNGSGPGRLA
jgi:small ligand-binding sensory domain FIST